MTYVLLLITLHQLARYNLLKDPKLSGSIGKDDFIYLVSNATSTLTNNALLLL